MEAKYTFLIFWKKKTQSSTIQHLLMYKRSTDLFGSFQSLPPVQVILAVFDKANLVRVQAKFAFHRVLHLHVFNLVIFLLFLAETTAQDR